MKKVKSKTPSRAQGNLKSKTQVNRMITKRLNNITETKVDGLQTYIAQPSAAANPIPGTANAGQIVQFHLGPTATLPSSWTGSWQSLDGIPNSTGTGSQERVGDYIFMRKTTVNLCVDVVPDQAAGVPNAPWEFRVVVGKSNRKYNPAGVAPDPNTRLLLTPSADARGFGTNTDERVIALSPPNLREFTIISDRKFTLEAQHTNGGALANNNTGHYGCSRTMQITLPHSKKVRFNSQGNPVNYDYHHFILVWARPIGGSSGSRWNVTTNGSTSYTDM